MESNFDCQFVLLLQAVQAHVYVEARVHMNGLWLFSQGSLKGGTASGIKRRVLLSVS